MATDKEFTDSLTHMVKQGLRLVKVYYAPWNILLEKIDLKKIQVIAWLPENITLPHGLKRSYQPIRFLHEQENEMHHFTDVHYSPIVSELAKEIIKSYHFGEKYGTSEAVNYKVHL